LAEGLAKSNLHAMTYEHWRPTSVRQAAPVFNSVLLTTAVARRMQLRSTPFFFVRPIKKHHDCVCHLQFFKAHANNKCAASEMADPSTLLMPV
jgi:hypothetical protein